MALDIFGVTARTGDSLPGLILYKSFKEIHSLGGKFFTRISQFWRF